MDATGSPTRRSCIARRCAGRMARASPSGWCRTSSMTSTCQIYSHPRSGPRSRTPTSSATASAITATWFGLWRLFEVTASASATSPVNSGPSTSPDNLAVMAAASQSAGTCHRYLQHAITGIFRATKSAPRWRNSKDIHLRLTGRCLLGWFQRRRSPTCLTHLISPPTETAWNTLQGYEVMNMLRKGQMRGMEKGDIMGQLAFIASLFGVAA